MIWSSTCCVHGGIEDRAQHFDTAVEIARHHVGGGNITRGFGMRQPVTGAETIDASMFEETADDGFDADILRQA